MYYEYYSRDNMKELIEEEKRKIKKGIKLFVEVKLKLSM